MRASLAANEPTDPRSSWRALYSHRFSNACRAFDAAIDLALPGDDLALTSDGSYVRSRECAIPPTGTGQANFRGESKPKLFVAPPYEERSSSSGGSRLLVQFVAASYA
jgi:hypothetical protein